MSAQEDFTLFSQVAEMLGLENDDHDNFITSAMKRRGHKPKLDWVDGDGDGKDDTGDFFTSKRRTRETERKVSKDKGWQYGS